MSFFRVMAIVLSTLLAVLPSQASAAWRMVHSQFRSGGQCENALYASIQEKERQLETLRTQAAELAAKVSEPSVLERLGVGNGTIANKAVKLGALAWFNKFILGDILESRTNSNNLRAFFGSPPKSVGIFDLTGIAVVTIADLYFVPTILSERTVRPRQVRDLEWDRQLIQDAAFEISTAREQIGAFHEAEILSLQTHDSGHVGYVALEKLLKRVNESIVELNGGLVEYGALPLNTISKRELAEILVNIQETSEGCHRAVMNGPGAAEFLARVVSQWLLASDSK